MPEARWESITSDDPTEAEVAQLDALHNVCVEYGAGKVTSTGRNEYDEITFCTTVANVEGRAVGVIIRPGVGDDGGELDVIVVTGPTIEDGD